LQSDALVTTRRSPLLFSHAWIVVVAVLVTAFVA
jgi:hypothetical protein